MTMETVKNSKTTETTGTDDTDFKSLIIRSIEKAKEEVREELSSLDYSVIQAVNALDEYNDVINRLYEKLFTWYDLYFPELKEINLSIQEYAKFVSVYDFEKPHIPDNLSKKQSIISKLLKNRIGAKPDPVTLGTLQKIAKDLFSLTETRDNIEKYIENTTKKMAPNMCAIVSPIIVARLIKHAGGLKKLALEPASTIQVYGAEKALFKHLRTGSKPPKHGIIFQIPEIAKSPKPIRGKISRLYANQLSIAAKADAFTHHDISNQLKEEIKKRLEEIKSSFKCSKHLKQKNQKKQKKQNSIRSKQKC